MIKQTGEFIAGFGELGTITIMALALLQCLFGYKFMKSWTLLIGFLIGFLGAYNIALQFIPKPVLYPALIAFAAGVLIAALAYLVHPLGVFLFAGFIVDLALLMIVPAPDTKVLELIMYIVAGVMFVIAGLLCARYRRPVVIFVTALAGSIVAVKQMYTLGMGIEISNYILMGITAGLCAVGVIVQFLTTMKEAKQEKAKKEKKEERKRESARRRAKRRGDSVRFDTPAATDTSVAADTSVSADTSVAADTSMGETTDFTSSSYDAATVSQPQADFSYTEFNNNDGNPPAGE